MLSCIKRKQRDMDVVSWWSQTADGLHMRACLHQLLLVAMLTCIPGQVIAAGLHASVDRLIAPGKGILAADESARTMNKRLLSVGVPAQQEFRNEWREVLLSTPGMASYISGVILYEETFKNQPHLIKGLRQEGIQVGIKLDLQTAPLHAGQGSSEDGETHTRGLDGLTERAKAFAALGATFSKWRAVFKVRAADPTQHPECKEFAGHRCTMPQATSALPSAHAVEVNARELAQYAAASQAGGLVPIVEPELLCGEGRHGIEACSNATYTVLRAVMASLQQHSGVDMDGLLLKPNMVLPGMHGLSTSDEEIARQTLDTLLETVPESVPGIAFLSGGQTEEQASHRLQLMVADARPKPWVLTYSYGRALQSSALKAWAKGYTADDQQEQNPVHYVKAAQAAFLQQAAACSAAALGQPAVSASVYERVEL